MLLVFFRPKMIMRIMRMCRSYGCTLSFTVTGVCMTSTSSRQILPVGSAFLSSQGSHTASKESRELRSCVLVKAFLSRRHELDSCTKKTGMQNQPDKSDAYWRNLHALRWQWIMRCTVECCFHYMLSLPWRRLEYQSWNVSSILSMFQADIWKLCILHYY